MSDVTIPYVYAGPVGAAAVVLPLLGTGLTAVRFYARRKTGQGIRADDWFTAAAVLALWGLAVILLHGISLRLVGFPSPPPADRSDFDRLQDNVNGEIKLQELEWAYWVLEILTFGLTKLAVLFFYRRLFVVQRKTIFNAVTWFAIGICALWTLIFTLTMILSCGATPWIYWAALSNGDRCIVANEFLTGLAGSDLGTDIIILFLPFPSIWQLQLPLRKKLSISLLMTLGGVSTVASALRLYTHNAIRTANHHVNIDLFLTLTMVFYWTIIEAGIALIATNVPTFVQVVMGRATNRSTTGSRPTALSWETSTIKSARSPSHGDINTREWIALDSYFATEARNKVPGDV